MRTGRRRHTSTQVTFWRLLEAILPGPAAGSRGVARLEMVARASDNGAFVRKDMCIQTAAAARRRGDDRRGGGGEETAARRRIYSGRVAMHRKLESGRGEGEGEGKKEKRATGKQV